MNWTLVLECASEEAFEEWMEERPTERCKESVNRHFDRALLYDDLISQS